MGYRAAHALTTLGKTYAAGELIPEAATFPGLVEAVIAGVIVPESLADIPGIVPEQAVVARMAEVACYLRDHGLPVPAGMAEAAGFAPGEVGLAAPEKPSEAPESAASAPEAPEAPKAAKRTRKATAKPEPITTEAPDPEA